MSAVEFPRLLKGAPPIGKRQTLAEYEANGGYQALKKGLAQTPDEITKMVLDTGLRGRGGAGFPAGRKWTFVPKNTGKPVYLAVNGDESEPGCFKDRQIIERVPHLLVEGAILACRAIGANTAYVYIRGEYPIGIRCMEEAVDEARAAGYLGDNVMGSGWKCDVWIHSGAGAYICGEETGMLSSIEGGRGYPRIKPPFPAVEGLWRSPTIINNVETIANVPLIVRDGVADWKSSGDADTPGTRLVGVSGHVNRPCHIEIDPAKTTLREIIFDHAGGIWKGRHLKAVIPGGSSVPVLPNKPEALDVPFTYGAVKNAGSLAGAAGVIVMDETTCMVDALLNLMEFYHHESCGQCTPCREGTGWLEKLVHRIWAGQGRMEDVDLLDRVADTVGGAGAGKTICFLADSAVMPTKSFIKHFRADFEAAVRGGGSPVYLARKARIDRKHASHAVGAAH
ncbi:MAG: NADH-quinone oxidoreductase subunit NuoF [Planctomycetes bacterium]|nr:NADH-quinone oxidoreductase subunit NuoF [Planctomycetota bacterium]